MAKQNASARFASLKTLVFRSGLWTLALALLALLLAVGVNRLVSLLPQDVTHIDTTSTGVFAFSDETEKLLSSLTEDVTLYCLASESDSDPTVSELLARYASGSSHIKVKYVDPVLYPNFAANYGEDISSGSVIAESALRATVVDYGEMYAQQLNYETYAYDSYLVGEGAVTGAIDFVTSENLPKVYYLTGHGEIQFGTALQSAIERQNIALVPLSLFALDTVPEDCECLILASPAADLTETEADAILAYLQGGGNLLLFTDYTETDMPNFDRILSYYGVTRGKGLIIEGDANHYLSQYVHYLLPDIRSHTVTDPLLEGYYYVLAPVAEPIFAPAEPEREGLSYAPLLTTTGESYRKTLTDYTLEDYTQTEDDLVGPFTVGLAITEDLIGGGDVLDEDEDERAHENISDAQQTRIVYFSTSYLLDPTVSAYVAGANDDLVKNALNWMTSREAAISISPKRISMEYLSMSEADSRIGAVLLFGFPLAFLAAGAIVLVRRARRRT